jgi:hypothetical protein
LYRKKDKCLAERALSNHLVLHLKSISSRPLLFFIA